MKNNMAAIWGSPGSGKTLTSVKIAKCLAEQKKNVIIVGCDSETPLIPLLFPDADNVQSLGNLLASPNPTEMSIIKHCVAFGKNKYISLLGYKAKENIRTYPDVSMLQVKELFTLLSDLADYVIVDCTSHITNDYLTATALEIAHVTFKIVNPGLKSIVYIQSQRQLLQDTRFKYSEQINLINNVLPSQETHIARESLGGTSYDLPHVTELIEQFDTGNLLDTVFGKNAKQYEKTMNRLVKEIF